MGWSICFLFLYWSMTVKRLIDIKEFAIKSYVY
ncbi:hypothetical protein BEH84_01098 [Eisenbergiella tayi]|uniref:Uncharacterized protein n=1 Tax=Eisenbergiella tayi TaxID=1432052 RepID=A0A1E3AXG4_9FIRM|nr:hypothetical protein BEH84_01098 [Eisenbergiella tayi]